MPCALCCFGLRCVCALQVDVVCGDHLLDHYQSLKDIQNSVGEDALQVGPNLYEISEVSQRAENDDPGFLSSRTVCWSCTLAWSCPLSLDPVVP